MVNELCSGLCIALEVKGCFEKNTHSEFRKLVGPFDPVNKSLKTLLFIFLKF